MPTVTLYRPVGPEELALIEGNVKASGAGYVTRFEVDAEFAKRYAPQIVGSAMHSELWVPAEELEEFNRHIVGKIVVTRRFPEA
jgi:hypothetical protein